MGLRLSLLDRGSGRQRQGVAKQRWEEFMSKEETYFICIQVLIKFWGIFGYIFTPTQNNWKKVNVLLI